jgi:hypothetical protein
MIGNSLAQFLIEVKYISRISHKKTAGKIPSIERKIF